MVQIAGHTFELTSNGRRCVAYSSAKGEICWIPWQHVRTCRSEDVDKTPGLAHHGTPTNVEYSDIRIEVAKEEAHVWEAVIDAASAGSR